MKRGGIGGSVGHEHYELIATIAKTEIMGSAELLKPAACVGEKFAADEMTMNVVDLFKSIEVEEGEADGCALGCAAFELAIEHVVKVASVEKAGAVVSDGELLNAGDVVGIFNRDRGVVGEDVKESDGVVGHLIGTWIDNLDDTMGTFAATERHCDD